MRHELMTDWSAQDPDGTRFRVAWLDLSEPNAAYVLTGREGMHLTSQQCREAAAHLTALAEQWDRNQVAHFLMHQTEEN
ncbi:hypothetical protein NCCP2495_05680 [Dietzia sp. NCCP-2495]|uniref:hypothetical protein n=1 Tax=Dietzia sp. NCCP-2495 TaxID=2934675 RepID=UPI00222F76F6|nr:hypothetical protein [Dietzia sp. NCCP-2495]GLB62690.1 hypothetical protein NCCP2495_05680 [Dietzia sp. NCCP-2495]